MAQVFSPYGLRVVKNLGEGYFSGGMHTYPVPSLTPFASTGLYFGDPVGLSGGSVQPLAASPTPGAATGTIGIFQGAEWQDPIRGFVNSQYLPAGLAGVTNVKVKVADYPWVIMRVQSDGVLNYNPPAASAAIGMNAALMGLPSTVNALGNSKVYLSTGTPSPTTPPLTAGTPIGTGALAVRIVGFVNDGGPSPGAGNLPGDPFTDVLVVWNFGVDRYLNATGG
jgi:hypothetical protein